MEDYIVDYSSQMKATLVRIDPGEIQRIVTVQHEERVSGRHIFLLGNGESTATPSHWANDFGKSAIRPDLPRMRVMALTDSVPLITAWANDSTYEDGFVEQLANFLKARDIVNGISGSGNSPNVLNAMAYAREIGALTLGLAGFAGGCLKDLADICIVVLSDSMNQIEDVHLILAHIISTYLRKSTAFAWTV